MLYECFVVLELFVKEPKLSFGLYYVLETLHGEDIVIQEVRWLSLVLLHSVDGNVYILLVKHSTFKFSLHLLLEFMN